MYQFGLIILEFLNIIQSFIFLFFEVRNCESLAFRKSYKLIILLFSYFLLIRKLGVKIVSLNLKLNSGFITSTNCSIILTVLEIFVILNDIANQNIIVEDFNVSFGEIDR